MATQKEIAARIFRAYPKIKEVYITTDNQAWVEGPEGKNQASLHARKLKEKDVATIGRTECATELAALEETLKKEAAAKLEAEKVVAYGKMNKAALLAECAKREPAIVPEEGATNAQIVALLEADDEK